MKTRVCSDGLIKFWRMCNNRAETKITELKKDYVRENPNSIRLRGDMQVNSARCPRQTDMVLAPAIYIWESPDYMIINVKRKAWNLLGKFIELLKTRLRLTWFVIWSQWKESKLENKRTNCQDDMYIVLRYIPLTNRVRGPYCKLRTEFFPPRFMAQARSARAINRRGKNEDP